jgi:hypothetical protein
VIAIPLSGVGSGSNIGTIVSGDWRSPFVLGDTIITLDEKIESINTPAQIRKARLRAGSASQALISLFSLSVISAGG